MRDLSWNSIGRHLVGSSILPCRSCYSDSRRSFLPVPLPRESLLGPALVARFQIEGVLLDVLDDVFLLNLALEPPESGLDGLALLNLDFSHAWIHPLYRPGNAL